MAAVLLEGFFYLGLLVFLCFGFTSAVATSIPFYSNYQNWWRGKVWVKKPGKIPRLERSYEKEAHHGEILVPIPGTNPQEYALVHHSAGTIPESIMPVIWLILFGCLVAGNFIAWQNPLFIESGTFEVLDETDLFTALTKGEYLTILSLGFIEWLMPPLYSYVVFRCHNLVGGVVVSVVECVIMIVLVVFAWLFYWLSAIFFSVYLLYAVYSLIIITITYIKNRDAFARLLNKK